MLGRPKDMPDELCDVSENTDMELISTTEEYAQPEAPLDKKGNPWKRRWVWIDKPKLYQTEKPSPIVQVPELIDQAGPSLTWTV